MPGLSWLTLPYTVSDPFICVFLNEFFFCNQEIIKSTEGELQAILDLRTKMMTKFHDVVKFYGESEAKMTTEDFFGYFAVFLVNFEVSFRLLFNHKVLAVCRFLAVIYALKSFQF